MKIGSSLVLLYSRIIKEKEEGIIMKFWLAVGVVIIVLLVGCADTENVSTQTQNELQTVPSPTTLQPQPLSQSPQPSPPSKRQLVTQGIELYENEKYLEAKKVFEQAKALGSNDAVRWLEECNKIIKELQLSNIPIDEHEMKMEKVSGANAVVNSVIIAKQGQATSYARAWVIAHFKAPKSATIETINTKLSGNTYTFTGLASGYNPMGVELTGSFTVRVTISGHWEEEGYIIDDYIISGSVN